MEIYLIDIDGKKYSQYKTYENAKKDLEILYCKYPNSNIKILVEEYCDNGAQDFCCKIYTLCEYKNLKVNEYI